MAANTDDVLNVQRLTKRIWGHSFVNGITFSLCSGEVLGLVGGNGSGKSLLLKMLAGLVPWTSGKVSIFGNTTRPTQFPARVGFWIEGQRVFGYMTARQVLTSRALAIGIADSDKTVRKALDNAGLSERANERMENCSPGDIQRLGLSLALMGSPRLLLLDEPFAGIDACEALRMQEVLAEYCVRSHAAVIMCSRTSAQLVSLATRYGVLIAGELVHEETAEEMLRACEERLVVS